jgi:hypothetical protein
MSVSDDDRYQEIFVRLKHPIRRRILRILSNGPKSFSDLQKEFKIKSSHMSYHLDGLGDLLYTTKDGKYALSHLGEAAVSMMNFEQPHIIPASRPIVVKKNPRKHFKLGRLSVPSWLVAVLIILMIGSVGLGAYLYSNTFTASLEINEPIEIISYPSQWSLYPGQSAQFSVTVNNAAPLNYSVVLDFSTNDTAYQQQYITFSDETYTVVPGQQNLEAWFNVTADAPPANLNVTVTVQRVPILTLASVGGNSPLYYIPFTLTNNQGYATSTNFQEQITVDSDMNAADYASNLDNVNWQDGAGNILNSWLESGITNTATESIYWVNLGSRTIAAYGGTLTIYEVIYATTVNCMNTVNTGAEPLYTAAYGQYDDGAAVFSIYDNFAGTSLSSLWTVPSGSEYSVNNGFVAVGSGGSTTAVYDASVQETSSLICEWCIAPFTIINPDYSELQVNRYTMNSNMHWLGIAGNDTLINAGSTFENVSVADTSGNNIFGLWNGGSTITWFFDYTSWTARGTTPATDYLSLTWSVIYAPNNFPTLYWVRTRLYPPSGVMPTVGATSAPINM